MKTKSIFLAGALCLAALSVQADVSEIDSLKLELSSLRQKGGDSRKMLEIYQNLSSIYETLNWDSSSYYLEKGMELYPEPDFTDKAYLYLFNTAATHDYVTGDFDKAKSKYFQLLCHLPRLEERDYEFEAAVHMGLGVVYRKLGMGDSTLYYYNLATDLAKKAGDLSTLSSIYYNIGAMFHADGRYEESLTNGKLSAQYAAEANDWSTEQYARILIGSAYARLKKFPESAAVLRENVENAIAENQPLLAMSSLSPLLSTYQLWGKKDSARLYLQKGEQLYASIPPGSPTALEFMGVQASLLNWMGDYRKSLELLLTHKEMVAQISYEPYHILLARNYEGLQNYKEAFRHLQDAYAYRDSVRNVERNQEMSELSAKLDLSAKELKISRLEKEQVEQNAQKLRLTIYLGLSVFLLLAGFFVWQHKRRLWKKESELVSVRRYIEGLENERKRIAKDLHDGVCSDLLGASMQLERSGLDAAVKQKIIGMLDEIRNGVRTLSHEMMPPDFQLTDLDEMLSYYFAKIEKQAGLQVHYLSQTQHGWHTIAEEVSYEIYRIVQELCSNALKHGTASEIFVEMSEGDRMLKLTFSYAGEWKNAGPEVPGGIGLRTMEDRLKMIHGRYELNTEKGISVSVWVDLCASEKK